MATKRSATPGLASHKKDVFTKKFIAATFEFIGSCWRLLFCYIAQ